MLLNSGVGKTLESLLDCKETQPVHCKGNQSWIFIGRTDAEAETPILWPPDVKNQLIWKDPDAGKNWRWEEKGTRENEMAGWHHWLNGHESAWTPGVGDGQEGLACCSPWVTKSRARLSNWTEIYGMPIYTVFLFFFFKNLISNKYLISTSQMYKCFELWQTEEKATAPHSSTLAWKIPWTEKPGRLLSTESRRVGHDWSDLAAAAAWQTEE